MDMQTATRRPNCLPERRTVVGGVIMNYSSMLETTVTRMIPRQAGTREKGLL
jgi:hypothetical protein